MYFEESNFNNDIIVIFKQVRFNIMSYSFDALYCTYLYSQTNFMLVESPQLPFQLIQQFNVAAI